MRAILGILLPGCACLLVASLLDGCRSVKTVIPVRNGGELAAVFAHVEHMRSQRPDMSVEIVLAGGDYDIPETIVVSEGSNFFSSASAPVVIRAAAGARVRLCGGTPVTGWIREPFNGCAGAWAADLPGSVAVGRPSLFFLDGRAQQLCRFPNRDPKSPYAGGWSFVDGKPVDMYRPLAGARDDRFVVRPADWRAHADPAEGLVNIFPRYNWWNKVMPVAETIRSNHTIRLAWGIGAGFEPRPCDRYCLLGYREDFDAPGEWYCARGGRRLHYLPPNGTDMTAVRVAVVRSPQAIFRFVGTRNVTLKGLEFCEAGMAVEALDAERVSVVGCRVHDVGTADSPAIRLVGRHNEVRDCDIWDVASYGVFLDGGRGLSYAPEDRDGNVVENCYIHHTGSVNRHGFGVYVGGQGSFVRRNLMHDLPRGGIYHSGRFHTIDQNRIRHCNLEMEDTAAIYGGGYINNLGTRIRGNWVSDSVGFSRNKEGHYGFYRTESYGIYLDDSSGGAEVSGNLVERCTGGAMHLHSARCNVISNNVFVSCGGRLDYPKQFTLRGWRTNDAVMVHYLKTRAQVQYEKLIAYAPEWKRFPTLADPPAKPHLPDGLLMFGNRFVKNVFYYPDEPKSCVYCPANYNIRENLFDENVIWCGANAEPYVYLDWKRKSMSEWKALGQETHGIVADPCFSDAKGGDWSYRTNSPVSAMGIVRVFPEKAGLYRNENRIRLPEEAEGVREHPEWLIDPK